MSVPFDMLLHPELLTNEQLICIIQERHLRVSNLRHMRRYELLDIFHHYCVPYGQRKYRDSGRGKLLNKNRPLSPEPTKKLNKINQEVKQNNLNRDRLKPPPECMSSFTKRFKIETTITPISNKDCYSVNKRKMSVDSVTVTNDCPPQKKERKPITWP